jgi:hypothetical protein
MGDRRTSMSGTSLDGEVAGKDGAAESEEGWRLGLAKDIVMPPPRRMR